jgi:hypothetical protein
MTTALLLSVVCSVLLCGLALGLAWIGVGRLMLAPPRCAGCGHDLRTTGPAPRRCAECGRDLHQRGAVSFGVRHRRRGALGGALVAMVLALLAPWLALMAQRAGALQPGLAAGAMRPTLGELLSAAESGERLDWRSVSRAIRAARPTSEEAFRLARVVQRDGSISRRALTAAERFEIDDACRRVLRVASQEDVAVLAKAWFGPLPVKAPERVVAGAPWSVTLHARELVDDEMLGRTQEGLAGRMDPFHPVLHLREVRLNGAVLELAPLTAATGVIGPSLVLSVPAADEPRAGPRRAAELEMDITRLLFRSEDLPRSGLPAAPEHWPGPIAVERVTLTRTVQFVEQGAALVALSTNPALRERMAGALEVTTCEHVPSGRRLLIKATLVPPGDIWIAGRWRVRVGERWHDGPLIAAWGTPKNFGVKGPLSWSIPLRTEQVPSRVDVAIEPVDNEPSILPRDGTPVWGERIERRGAPVTLSGSESPGARP